MEISKLLSIKIMIVALFVVLFFHSNLTLAPTNSTNSMPPNAIRTPNGGWVTPLQTHDAKGNKLTIHYEVGVPIVGGVSPRGPDFGIKPPLKQFKSGITSQDVSCKQGLWLIFKTSDGSPACVKPEAAYTLIYRGWSNEISKTSLHTVPSASFAPCDTPYPQSDVGVAVLYMPANSTGKICATYHNSKSQIQAGIKAFAARDVQQQASEIITSVYPDMLPTGNSTIVYTIKTGNQAGLFGISFFCGGVPLAVGYDNQSRIILDDFPWLDNEYQCLYQSSIFQITGLSGIQVKYVTVVHRD